MADNFCHLHLHNEYSVLDGVGTSEQYSYRARDNNQTHLALTNHGNIDGALVHQKVCKKAGVKPIVGCEFYLVKDIAKKEKGEKRYHVTLLVENQTGWQNMLKMLTIANLEGFYHRPRIDWDILQNHLEGLVVLTGCSMSFLNMRPGWRSILEGCVDILGKERVFLEVMPHNMPEQIETNKRCLSLGSRYGLELVATNDCHYPTNRSAFYQEVLLAIQSRKKMADKDRWKFSIDGLHLKTRGEMQQAFEEQGVLFDDLIEIALDNTMLVAGICEGFEIKKIEPSLPSIGLESGQTDRSKMRDIVNMGWGATGLSNDFGHAVEYTRRMEEELDQIYQMKFERYFLIVWDLINWCKKNDILVGPGRGSIGGSLVAYLMGITDVDPIKYDLVFSRFISPDRIDLPDIDMDFEDRKRHLVKEYLQQKYGEFNVVGLSTFLTMKGKGVLRDVARVYDIPLKEVDVVAKAISDDTEKSCQVKESFATIPECLRFKKKYPDVVEVAEGLEGQIRGSGQHAAAVCISTSDLREGKNCNLSMRSGTLVANWDKDVAEHMGLVKFDILGLSALSILSEAKALIKKNHGVDVDFTALELNDPKVFRMIADGKTTGAFQIGARGLSRFCQDMEVDSFDAIVAATALYRPGPLHSGMAEEFIKIKNGKKKVKKIHPLYDEITEGTYGIIVYQEQVMSVINKLSGLDMASCDKIRKLMAKSKGEAAIDGYKTKFLDGCAELKTVDKKTAANLWKTILTFGKYGFNKAHSVEYSMITYWDMWLKAYYPSEFLAACLTYGGDTHFKDYIAEARKTGLTVRLPKIGLSHATKWGVDNERNLFAPFACIKGIGEASAQVLSDYNPSKKKQKGFFQSKFTGAGKIPGVNKTIITLLEEIKAFDPVGEITREERRMVSELFR